MRDTLEAIRHLERAWSRPAASRCATAASTARPDDAQIEIVRKRRFPIVGDGGGMWSFVHLDDAAAATVLALDRGLPGIYNVVDDDPRRCASGCRRWPRRSARSRRATCRVARPARGGRAGVVMMTEIRGASNAKAKRELGWPLRYPSWRQGFRAAYSPGCAPSR